MNSCKLLLLNDKLITISYNSRFFHRQTMCQGSIQQHIDDMISKTTPDQTQLCTNTPYKMTLSKYFANNTEPFSHRPCACGWYCVHPSSAALPVLLPLTKHMRAMNVKYVILKYETEYFFYQRAIISIFGASSFPSLSNQVCYHNK